MEIFNEWKLRFEKPDWAGSPELGLIDTILELKPELINLLKKDIIRSERESSFGRKDTPSVEQIVRAGIYKEMKGLDYRALEFAQVDSRICALFIKLDYREPFSFQVLQKYISRISAGSLHHMMVEINKVAIMEGLEDVSKLRQDSTVVESDIHHPTNNSLVWDCIRVSHRLLEQLKEEVTDLKFGHKVNLVTGKSNLILDIHTEEGNPADTTLYQPALNRVLNNYGIIPRDNVTDGGYASLNNMNYSKEQGIVNIVFNKIVGSLQNRVSSLNIETRLKKWRSGIEANISNWKRGFNIRRCYWKGWAHFQAKVLWSTIAYNFRVLTGKMLYQLRQKPLAA